MNKRAEILLTGFGLLMWILVGVIIGIVVGYNLWGR